MKNQTINPTSFKMGNFKNQNLKKVVTKNKFDEDDDVAEKNEDYTIVDEDDNFIEPSGPKKEDLKIAAHFIENDDDDDDEEEDF